MTCPLCRVRKVRRACPAVGEVICTVCCGTKRLKEIACPQTCIYLKAAERHPAAPVKRQQERDLTVLIGSMGRLSEGQLQLFFLLQTFIARFIADGHPLVDRDVAEAAGALAETFETAARGVLYEHQVQAPAAEGLRRELKGFLAEIGGSGGVRFEREAAVVLRGIAKGAGNEAGEIGEGPQAYLTLVARILHERAPTRAGGSPIVLP